MQSIEEVIMFYQKHWGSVLYLPTSDKLVMQGFAQVHIM